jgi:hypothetical protein
MLECRSRLKTNSEPCSKAKVVRNKIAAISTPPRSYLQLQESSKEANKNDSSYLPLELRVMIYEYVFYSESRYVQYIFRQSDDGTFTPRFESCVKPKYRGENTELAVAANANRSATLPQPMTALLRTCKQIFNEGKPVFWKENGLAFIPDPKTGHIFVPFQNAKFLYHVPRVLLDFHHHEWSNALSTTARMFKVLGCLAEKECLKEIALVGVPHESRAHDDMVSRPFMFLLYYTIHHHEDYYRVLDILSDAGEQKGTISKLERKILIEADDFEVQHGTLFMPAELK